MTISPEVLAAAVRHWADHYGGLVHDDLQAVATALLHTARELEASKQRERVLREALRSEVIEPTPYLTTIETRCRLCRARWPNSMKQERHAPGCLAALKDHDKT